MSDADRWDIAIAALDAYDGDPDLEDSDSEDSDEDGVTVVFGQWPMQQNEDDEPDGPAQVWDERNAPDTIP